MATGRIINAQEALEIGLINRVVPFELLDSTVNGIATTLASSPSIALAKIKEGLNHGERNDLATALEFEAVNQADCFRSQDFAEGVRAFLEKRMPNFQGK
jgi:enoyl-CoA hydratase/carnithine racemase